VVAKVGKAERTFFTSLEVAKKCCHRSRSHTKLSYTMVSASIVLKFLIV